jgi:hypothetical protein
MLQNNSGSKLKEDLLKIQSLVQIGVLNSQQGQNLMNHVIRKAYDMVSLSGFEKPKQPETLPVIDKKTVLSQFNNENPDFFNSDGRNEVMDYLNSERITFDKDELLFISKLVEKVEQAAIDRYLKKEAYEKNMMKFNDEAKQKLQANAQNSKNDGKNFSVFTREQIGKMNGAEFAKNESLIMDQLRKGLIR